MKKYMVTCRSGFLKICSEVMRLFKLIKKADELKVLFDSLQYQLISISKLNMQEQII